MNKLVLAVTLMTTVAHAEIVHPGFSFDEGVVSSLSIPDVSLTLNQGFLSVADAGPCDWYVAQEGAILYSGSGNNVGFQSLDAPVAVGLEEFFVAVICQDSGPCGDDSFFGWMHFNVQPCDVIELTDSAVAFDECGIFVGTIPEPATLGLVAASGFALLFIRRLSM